MVLEVGLDWSEATTMSYFFELFCETKNGAGSRTRTYEGRSREIYSLLSLPLDDSSNTYIIHNLARKAIAKYKLRFFS